MFNLFGRNFRFSVFKTASVRSLFPRSLSSSPAASDNSFSASYLIDSCGLPPDKANSASKHLKFKTSDRADSVIAFFKNQGFTESQAYVLVRKSPKALKYHPEKNLLPKFEFLSSIGLSNSEIIKLITTSPSFLGRSLKNHLEPTFNLLRDLLQSNDRTLTVIKGYPVVLDWNLHENMAPNIQLLRDVGMPGSNILYLLTYHIRDFLVPTEHFKKDVQKVVEMGFNPLKSSFMLAFNAIRSISKPIWEKKMETYENWGWSKDQILVAFRNFPLCMKKSEEKINKVMDYLVNKMGCETSYIAKNPLLVSLSMEKRIIPRCLVYKYCLDNGLIKNKIDRGFAWWLKSSENIFIKKLERFEKQVPGVLKFYQEKLDSVK